MIFCARATRGRGLPSLDARSGRSFSPHPRRDNKQAWRDQFSRSTVLAWANGTSRQIDCEVIGGRAGEKTHAVEDQSALVSEDFISVAHGTDLAGHPLHGSGLSPVGIGNLSGGVTKPSASDL